MAIGHHIDPKDWDDKKQSPRSSLRGRNDLVKLKARMADWENAIIKLFRDVGPTMTKAEFKQELLYRMEVEERPGDLPKDFFGFLAAFVESRKQRPGATRTSWGKFASLQTHLLQFEKDNDIRLTWDEIDWQFKDDFTAWMYAPPRSFSINNASKMFDVLKTVMKDAFRKKVHSNRIQEDNTFAIGKVKTKNKIRLTVEELYQLEKYDFSERLNLERARDLMLFASWTGLRISDWWSIKRHNIRLTLNWSFGN